MESMGYALTFGTGAAFVSSGYGLTVSRICGISCVVLGFLTRFFEQKR